MEEDSLSNEILRQLHYRPHTTGEVESHESIKIFPHRESKATLLIDSPKQHHERKTIRPRAPRRKPNVVEEDSSHSVEDHRSSDINRVVQSSTRRRKSTLPVSDLWRELNHFAKNNLSRSLADSNANGVDIHYINSNLENSKSKGREKTSTKQQALFSTRKRFPEDFEFKIPELPSGAILTFNILSTHGKIWVIYTSGF